MKLIGLIDCNNFFVSCERVFAPSLAGKPVVVAGNNGGCAVAMSPEAKQLGITRGLPVFQAREIILKNDIITIPGNHRLYGDLSSRVMATIESIVPDIEIYSIDEAFIHFPELSPEDVERIARDIVIKVRRNVGIPTSLGIAPTKTLAKVAARIAKSTPTYRAVYRIDTDLQRREALESLDVGDIWGIGRKLATKLKKIGINKAIEFADLSSSEIKQIVSVPGQRTWRELNGVECIDKDPESDIRKQICTTRTFSPSVTEITDLQEAISLFTTIASRKLRRQKSVAKGISVFLQTNSYLKNSQQYCNSTYRHIEEPTSDLLTLNTIALDALTEIFRDGYIYRRAGVIITDTLPQDAIQPSLFTSADMRKKRVTLNQTLDNMNSELHPADQIRVATSLPEPFLPKNDN